MKKTHLKLFIIIAFAFTKSWSQELKFPESFHSDTSLFKGMKIAEIPATLTAKYGISKNPGVATDVAKIKGLFMSSRIPGVQAIYYEVWEHIQETRMDCGFEVAKFSSIDALNKIISNLRPRWRDGAFLTVQNYLIIVNCDGYKNFEERIDDMIKCFQQKLGAKLIQDRLKEVAVAVTENYVTNLPPPLPPSPKGDVTQLAIEDLDKRIANTDGLAYMRYKNRKKLAPGNYLATAMQPFETLSFTIDKDSLLHGDYQYHYAEDYSKSPSRESKLTYDNGVLLAEIIYKDGKLLGSKTNSASVIKNGKDYLITLTTYSVATGGENKNVVTVFRNQKPILKTTTRAGVSVIKKDFEKKVLEHFNSKGQLTKLKKRGLTEEYDATGKVTYKDEWIGDDHFVYNNGKLSLKEIQVKGKQQYLVTEYDELGKVKKEFSRGVEDSVAIANPDEYESDLSEALFNYYKKKVE